VSISDLSTIQDYIRYAFSRFNDSEIYFGHGTNNAWDEALQLILHSLHLPWDFDPTLWSASLTQKERSCLLQRIEKRITARIPVPYLVGEAWFMNHPFYVDERVLIPRSPIAELIQRQFQPWLKDYPFRILDLCTGSGCIGIASALEFDTAQVDLLDISKDALVVAQKNIQRYRFEGRVTAIQSDLFENATGRYDLIVSNPPYVDQKDFSLMPQEFSAEPRLGLISGKEGLDCVHRILKQASNYLTDNGLLIVEVGNSYVALEEYYDQVPFTWIEFEHGGHGVFVFTANELKSYFSL